MMRSINQAKSVISKDSMNTSWRKGYSNASLYIKKYVKAMKRLAGRIVYS